MIINYSILLTFDRRSHVSAFDLEAVCAWHMKHILWMWFITELSSPSRRKQLPGGSPSDRDSLFAVGAGLWLQRMNLNSEESQNIGIFQMDESFGLLFKAWHCCQTFPSIVIIIIFLISGYENCFPKSMGVSPSKISPYKPRMSRELIHRVSDATGMA